MEYGTKPFRDHGDSPAISIFVLDDDAPTMDKISCIFCKRTITDMKGRIDNIVTSPLPLEEYGIVFGIRCKLCHQNYRLLPNSQISQG